MRLSDIFTGITFNDSALLTAAGSAARFVLPLLAVWILIRCVRSMLNEKYEPETWAYIYISEDEIIPVCHWEAIVGRSSYSDVVVDFPTVSRSHAVLIRSDDGLWRIHDIGSSGGTRVNGDVVERGGHEIGDGDVLMLADVETRFVDLSEDERDTLDKWRNAPGRFIRPGFTLFLVTLCQMLLTMELMAADGENAVEIALGFAALIVTQWCYYLIMRSIRRSGFEVESIAFFLSSIGMAVCASSVPGDMMKQVILTLAGIALFIFLGWWLRGPSRTKAMRWPAAGLALVLLGLNLLLSQEIFGAKNWLSIGGVSFQPSELVKIAYIYVGSATLDRLFVNRNLFMFIGFSAVCVGALALMGDFGSALIFFTTFLVISFMRSGNLATIFLAVSSAGLAGFLVLTVKPYIAQRFASWGHVWEDVADKGYQQVRAMSAAASGGLFGQGAGRGWLHGIVAADTDMVFAMVSEELGLIVAVCAVLAILALAAFTVKNASSGRSSYYVIAACSAICMMMVQMCLNVFGALDILPFTGVTFPFVSKGGSSLISCWALLAFIKASDTRAGASFVVKPPATFYGGGEIPSDGGDGAPFNEVDI